MSTGQNRPKAKLVVARPQVKPLTVEERLAAMQAQLDEIKAMLKKALGQ